MFRLGLLDNGSSRGKRILPVSVCRHRTRRRRHSDPAMICRSADPEPGSEGRANALCSKRVFFMDDYRTTRLVDLSRSHQTTRTNTALGPNGKSAAGWRDTGLPHERMSARGVSTRCRQKTCDPTSLRPAIKKDGHGGESIARALGWCSLRARLGLEHTQTR